VGTGELISTNPLRRFEPHSSDRANSFRVFPWDKPSACIVRMVGMSMKVWFSKRLLQRQVAAADSAIAIGLNLDFKQCRKITDQAVLPVPAAQRPSAAYQIAALQQHGPLAFPRQVLQPLESQDSRASLAVLHRVRSIATGLFSLGGRGRPWRLERVRLG
jgi:hypothetical protein